jgi:hypothetical protein
MRRFLYPIIVFAFFVPTNAQVPASKASDTQAQNPVPDISSEEVPRDSVPQNVPCVGQPKSRRELAASFQQARFPLTSQITGTWVEIGDVSNDPSEPLSLNCSGVERGSKFEFALVASGYAVELHAIGMTYPQKVTMEPDHKGSVKFPVDFSADEGPDTYHCRLTKRGTLACLANAYSGVEFKKMTVQQGRTYDVTEVP